MKPNLLLNTLLACSALGALQAQQSESAFAGGLDGWSVTGAALSWEASGGNPGGYLKVVDQPHFSYLLAPAKFLGDLSAFVGGTLQFDLVEFSRELDEFADSGDVTIISGTNRATANVAQPPFSNQWTTYSIPLSAAAWGKTEAQWLLMLSNVTEIQVVVDPGMGGSGGTDVTGFDNFKISGSPIPRLKVRPRPGSEVELCWDTLINTWYQLQYRTSLTTNQWVPLTGGWIPGTGARFCTNDPVVPTVPHRFYRLSVTNSPP